MGMVKLIIIIAVIAVILYLLALAAMAIATVAAIGGSIWGGGWAILNYCRAIKEHLIDSNRSHVTT